MQEGSEHMLSVVRRQGRDLLPPGSDNPRLEVVRLLAGHTQCVAQVVVALGAGQLPLVSPENCVSVVTTLAVLLTCRPLAGGGAGRCCSCLQMLDFDRTAGGSPGQPAASEQLVPGVYLAT